MEGARDEVALYYGKGSARIRLQWYLLVAQVSFLLFGALLLAVRDTRCITISACGQNSVCVRKL
jgi:hypothetical protein